MAYGLVVTTTSEPGMDQMLNRRNVELMTAVVSAGVLSDANSGATGVTGSASRELRRLYAAWKAMQCDDFEIADGSFDRAKLASLHELEACILKIAPVTAVDLAIRFIVEGAAGENDIGADFTAYCRTLVSN